MSVFMRGQDNTLSMDAIHRHLRVFRLPFYSVDAVGHYIIKFDKTTKRYLQDGDLFFVQNSRCVPPLRVARKLGKPIVRYMHAVEWDVFTKGIPRVGRPLVSPLAKLVKSLVLYSYRCSDHIFVPSQDMVGYLDGLGVKTPASVLPLGIDVHRFCPPQDKGRAKAELGLPPDSVVLGYVGRFSQEKNVPMLARVFDALSKDYPNLHLLCLGSGSDRIVKKLRVNDRAHIIPSQENVLPYLHAMDVFCMPSVSETTSLATMEAMATGVPVVASAIGCIAEYVDHMRNGFLFEQGNEAELKEYCQLYLEDPGFRAEMGRAAHMTMQRRNSWQTVADGVVSTFERLLDGKPVRSRAEDVVLPDTFTEADLKAAAAMASAAASQDDNRYEGARFF